MITVVVIGSGNMAQAIIKVCLNTDINIVGIYSRNHEKLFEIAKQNKINYFENTKDIPTNADLYLLCVNDDAIENVSNNLVVNGGLVVHFSGLKNINEIGNQENKAVFWPIESIHESTFINFKNTPICIEANSDENYRIIEAFADRLSKNVLKIKSEQRQYFHLAATITNNFSNHLIALAKNELDHKGLDYQILKHLLSNALNNSFNFEPQNTQTGPAFRYDLKTMQKHLELIENNQLKTLYQLMSKSIFELKQNNNNA
jgi:predicted short-subunit dehydrogenase-like oxidoreductase (DUF2520 family)